MPRMQSCSVFQKKLSIHEEEAKYNCVNIVNNNIKKEYTHTHKHTQKKDTAATTGETSVQTIHSKQLGGNNRVW